MLYLLDELQKLSLTFKKDESAIINVKNAQERTRLSLTACLQNQVQIWGSLSSLSMAMCLKLSLWTSVCMMMQS